MSWDIFESFRMADALDILIVSLLVYTIVLWIRDSTHRFLFIGVIGLSGLYSVAQSLDMYLTVTLFKAGFTLIALTVVIVFQEDIRRVFVRIAAIGRNRERPVTEESSRYVDVLVDVVEALVNDRTGALIVLQGREALDRHLEGGQELVSDLSRPLLLSIFDTHSPGHDGAVIVDRGRVVRFSAHLPLARSSTDIEDMGTRHRAALGLSACSDALVVVVSEERGTVSIAQEGRLEVIGSVHDLRKRLHTFIDEHFPQSESVSIVRTLQKDMPLKALALFIGMATWVNFARNVEIVQRTFLIPIEYRNVSPELTLDPLSPLEVRLTLSGSERDYTFLSPSLLKISIDLSQSKEGIHTVVVDEKYVKIPSNLNVYRIEPRYIRFRLVLKS